MEVGVRVFRHVIVEDNVDTLDIHASSEQVGSHQHTLAEALEGLVLGESRNNHEN